MASSTANIHKEDWEEHKATILQLYSEKGLPITRKNDPEKDQCVDWIMRNHHGFSASKWQYENQLKKWGVTKNLKQDEWVSLLAHHDRLETQGKEVRIVISGKVQTKEKIRKARQRYCRPSAARPHTSPEDTIHALSRQAFAEIKEGGLWRRCDPVVNSGMSMTMIPSLGVRQSTQERLPGESGGPSAVATLSQRRGTPFESLGDTEFAWDEFADHSPSNTRSSIFHFDSNPVLFQMDTGHVMPLEAGSELFRSPINPLTPLSNYVPLEHRNPRPMEVQNRNQSPTVTPFPPTRENLGEPELLLAWMLREESANITYHDSAILASRDITTNRFQSLVSVESEFWQEHRSSQSVEAVFNFRNEHLNTLLYSLINGFASLDDIPRGSILQMLSGHEGFSRHLMNILRTGPDSVAKQLTDNLFRAAVLSGDSRAVALILKIIQTRPSIAIDVNSFAVKHGLIGGTLPALAFALKSGNEELIETLLNYGATPIRPENGFDHLQPALEIAMGTVFPDILAKARTIVLLIKYGAEITPPMLRTTLSRAAEEPAAFEAVMEGIATDRHTIAFEGDLVTDISLYVENTVATTTIQRLIDACITTHCGECLSHTKTMNHILAHAARRGNTELVNIVAPYATSPTDALAGAVRSGKMQLVRFLVQMGARADGPPVDLDNDHQNTTPLAQAIILQDSAFVEILAECGAWSLISKREHFEPAIAAAAEVGSLHYLDTIISRAQPLSKHQLNRATSRAMAKAIEANKYEMVLVLLKTGACTNLSAQQPFGPICDAIKNRNKQMVLTLLKTDWGYGSIRGLDTDWESPIELACKWGDMEIIDTFLNTVINSEPSLDMGRDLTPLSAAVKSRNLNLVEYLWELGADPGAKATSGSTPLAEAIGNRDYVMMEYLIGKGATPMDEGAFSKAQQLDDLTAFSKLCSAVLGSPPSRRKHFGVNQMIEAIYANNQRQIDAFVAMEVHVHRLTDWWWFKNRALRLSGLNSDEIVKILADVPRGRISPVGFAILYRKGHNSRLLYQLLNSSTGLDSIAREVDDLTPSHFGTPLLLAIEIGSKEMVRILLDKGVNINRPACQGIIRTPLQKASEMGNYDIVELLLQNGADVGSPPAKQHGGTALQLAAKSGSMKICELLLDNGADPHAPAPEFGGGQTAFEWAAEMGRYHVLLLLWKVARRDGFTIKIVQGAQDLARENGHRGCVDIITSMVQEVLSGRLIS